MVNFIVVRHAESLANVWKPTYQLGDSYNFLSLRGVKQAELAGLDIKEYLDGRKIDHIITSDMNRTKQTAITMLQAIGEDSWKRDYKADQRLNEWCWQAEDPVKWWNAESVSDFESRISAFFSDNIVPAYNKRSNDTYLIVAHYYTMCYLNYRLRSLFEEVSHPVISKDYDENIKNAQPFYFEFDKNANGKVITPNTYVKKR